MSTYFILNRTQHLVGVVDEYEQLKDLSEELNFISSWDIKTFDEATRLAEEATQVTGRDWLPVDRGDYIAPRFGVVEAPQVGDAVSYTFNGDYYPCGHIIKISDGYYRIQTTTGEVFYRRHHSCTWKQKGGMWVMVKGHTDRQSREF